MGIGHDHGHAGVRHRWRLAVSFGLVAGFFVVELVTALTSGSLALLSDAGHMAADVVTLGAALLATRIASRKDTTGRRTYGSYRAEVFASLLAVLMMFGVAAWVLVESIRRIGAEPEVAVGPMVVVGALGLVINVIALFMLRGGAEDSLNVKGAYYEVIADTVGSVGVIVAAGLITITGAQVWDVVIGLAIGIFVAVRAASLGRQVLHVLNQNVPAGVDPEAVAADLAGIDGVVDVHDLHMWTLTSGMLVATAHLVADESDVHDVLDRARELLRTRYAIEHATLQVEPATHKGCQEVDW